jgi:hypothetical protein
MLAGPTPSCTECRQPHTDKCRVVVPCLHRLLLVHPFGIIGELDQTWVTIDNDVASSVMSA